jgi:hypothetical protein
MSFSEVLGAIAKLIFCHPERRAGSQVVKNTRFFASLRMIYEGVFGFLQ